MKGIFQGLAVTFKWLFAKSVTTQYPVEKYPIQPRYRGLIKQRGYLDLEKAKATEEEVEAPPCQSRCPAHVDIRQQNALISQGKFVEAYRIVQERNILPGSLGRICSHPCEVDCQRGFFDEPIAIRPLHLVASEMYAKAKDANKKKKPLKPVKKEKVAIIGGGPSGLAAAFDLTKWGYEVVVFEKQERGGGMLRVGVPKYRLPKDLLQREVEDLASFGFEIRTGVEVGKDVTINDLKNQGFDAILISVGLQKSSGLPAEGTDVDGVVLALPFLEAVNLGKKVEIGKKVVVVGGGDVAIDCARSAIRLGSEALIVYRRSREEMPASLWEIEETEHEGIKFELLANPVKVLSKNRKVSGVECIRMRLSEPDESGRRRPVPIPGSEFKIETDCVIPAIGQYADFSFLEGSGVKLDEKKRLIVDKLNLSTTEPGVFACGEAVTGPSTAVASIATGHDAAYSIHNYLQGKTVKEEDFAFPECTYQIPYFDVGIREGEEDRHRVPMLMAEAKERIKDFRKVELGLSTEEGVVEALRCLRCLNRRCVGCRFCSIVCPNSAIAVERSYSKRKKDVSIDTYQIDFAKCIFCGFCTEVCPTKSLFHTSSHEMAAYRREELLHNKKRMLEEEG